ncbi:hypothetical protein G4B88_001022 [Cannabis sativa]|uniref:Uncharacterized protein n=1 Tax=Cannabis sativa TaxID=3483 RepID=A0A7J6FBY9_CANSA|nr:hypothetical protein G4B88_001022 [Cannabis sativa]
MVSLGDAKEKSSLFLLHSTIEKQFWDLVSARESFAFDRFYQDSNLCGAIIVKNNLVWRFQHSNP